MRRVQYEVLNVDLLFCSARLIVGAEGEANVTHRDMVVAFEEAIHEVKDELKKKGQENKFIGARVSLSPWVTVCV